jgi:cystathionine beta-lyase family protein involved in aluminum resistance
MVTFCREVQRFSPVDSYLSPVPSEMAGYEDEVIMAAGSFVEGATMEFSADGPMRAPYRIYMQGGLSYEHVKLAVCHAVNAIYFGNK